MYVIRTCRGERRRAGQDALWTWTLVKARQLLFSIDCLTFYLLFLCFCNIRY